MDNNGNMTIKTVLDGMIGAYAQRDKSIEFSEWLTDRLRQEMPDMPQEASEKLAGEIVAAVADYDNTLNELNQAIEAGESKEEWLADRLSETYADMPLDAAGEKLQMVETGLAISNMQLMGEGATAETTEISVVDAEPVEWNKYSLKDKVYEIGKQATLVGMAAAAKTIEEVQQTDENGEVSIAIGRAFQENLKGEVKAVVAGAVKVAAEKGIGDMLPDTPVEMVCDMAGIAIEGAEAMFDAANGDITMTEALDKVGRAGVAAGCRAGRYALEGAVMKIPVAGPLLVDLLGGLFEHMESPQFFDNVYVVVRDAAKATWEGIKKSVGGKIAALKRMTSTMHN